MSWNWNHTPFSFPFPPYKVFLLHLDRFLYPGIQNLNFSNISVICNTSQCKEEPYSTENLYKIEGPLRFLNNPVPLTTVNFNDVQVRIRNLHNGQQYSCSRHFSCCMCVIWNVPFTFTSGIICQRTWIQIAAMAVFVIVTNLAQIRNVSLTIFIHRGFPL